jgi:hypothetical protein
MKQAREYRFLMQTRLRISALGWDRPFNPDQANVRFAPEGVIHVKASGGFVFDFYSSPNLAARLALLCAVYRAARPD